MTLWIAGQYISGEYPDIVWQFAGIFDSREQALAWCRDRTYFISPVPLNVGAPHETEAFPGFWYPLAGEAPPELTAGVNR